MATTSKITPELSNINLFEHYIPDKLFVMQG